MKDANGLDAAPRCHQLAHTEQEAGDTVNPDEAAPSSGRHYARGLTVDERRGPVVVEPDGRPSGQSPLGRLHPRPAAPSPGGARAPPPGPRDAGGADAAAHEILDRAAAAERGTDVGREHPHVCPLAADNTDSSAHTGDPLDGDRPGAPLAGRSRHLATLP